MAGAATDGSTATGLLLLCHIGQACSPQACSGARESTGTVCPRPPWHTRARTQTQRSHRNHQAAPQTALLGVWAGTALLRDALWRLQPKQPRARCLMDHHAQSPCAACRNGGCMLPRGVACYPRSDRGTSAPLISMLAWICWMQIAHHARPEIQSLAATSS